MFQFFKEDKQLFASSRISLQDLLRVRDQTAPQVTDQQVGRGHKPHFKHQQTWQVRLDPLDVG